MDEVRLGLASVTILSVVRGLPSERSTVADAIRTTNPNVVALSIGPEELQTLRVYHGGPLEPENFEEEIYVAGLSAWESPIKPPPCFTEAVRVAEKQGTRLEAIDMDEVTYTENYVDSVSTLEVIFQGRLERRLAKKRFDARTPQGFVLAAPLFWFDQYQMSEVVPTTTSSGPSPLTSPTPNVVIAFAGLYAGSAVSMTVPEFP